MIDPVARPTADVLGIRIDAVDMENALARIARSLENREKGYVCLANVHSVMEARRDPSLAAIYAGAALTVPDGMPAVWVGHLQGHVHMQRVAGPDFMLEIFQRKEFAGYSHFLCGGKETVAEELRGELERRFPWTRIVGTYAPPFRTLTSCEEEEFIARVRQAKPDIIWVGISTPKQDRFMHQYLSRLDTTLMFGVGAAFDFHTGRIQDCADWIKHMGLQWLDRLRQDPRHLWKRYLRNNPAFLIHIFFQLTIRSLMRTRFNAAGSCNDAETVPARKPRTSGQQMVSMTPSGLSDSDGARCCGQLQKSDNPLTGP